MDGRQRVAALGFPCIVLVGEVPVTAGPGDEVAAAAAGRGHLRASHVDREHVIETLKAAFVQGRLAKDEFDARVGQTFASRTYAELAALTADLPIGLAGARPLRKPARAQARPLVNTPVKASVRVIIAAIMMLAAPFATDAEHHPLAAVALDVGAVIIFVASFIAWAWILSAQPEKRSRGQLPPRPAQRGHALEGERDGTIGNDLTFSEVRRDVRARWVPDHRVIQCT